MQKRIRGALALLAAVLFSGVPNAVQAAATLPVSHSPASLNEADVGAFLDGLVPYAIKRADIAGAGIVVVKDGKVLFEKGYGYSDVAKRTPVNPDRTLFRPGSVSKLFTWTSVMQLVQQGKLNLDADVNQYLDFKIPEKYGKPVTLRNLMTHTPGFDESIRDLFVENAKDLYPMHDYLVKRMPARIYPPGEVIAYSNYGATLAGYIVQRVSGEPFDQYVARHVFDPLHMTLSTVEQPLPPALAPLMSKGYAGGTRKPPTPFELVQAAPAGSSSTTVSNMANFMIAYLQGGRYDGGQILNPATIREMWTPQVLPEPGMPGFCLGFYQEDRNGQTIVGHAGDTDAFHSDLYLMPNSHIGFYETFNSAGTAGAVEKIRMEIFRAFLDRYYPYTPPVEKTVANPQRDAARVSGWYQSSRRSERALRLVYALGQTSISALPNGEIEVAMLTNAADQPRRWREVGPLYYRQTDGQAHLKFRTDANGRILWFSTDDFPPVFVFQPVYGLESLGSLKTLLACFIAVLLISLLIRLGAWIARRKLHLRLELTDRERWVHLAARIGAIMFLLTLGGWVVLLSNEGGLLSASLPSKMVVLYIAGVIAILGGVAMIAEAVMRIARGPGGWLVRIGEAIVALAAIYGIWLFVAFGLVNFVTNF